jgi:hypothetical protein
MKGVLLLTPLLLLPPPPPAGVLAPQVLPPPPTSSALVTWSPATAARVCWTSLLWRRRAPPSCRAM